MPRPLDTVIRTGLCTPVFSEEVLGIAGTDPGSISQTRALGFTHGCHASLGGRISGQAARSLVQVVGGRLHGRCIQSLAAVGFSWVPAGLAIIDFISRALSSLPYVHAISHIRSSALA